MQIPKLTIRTRITKQISITQTSFKMPNSTTTQEIKDVMMTTILEILKTVIICKMDNQNFHGKTADLMKEKLLII